MSFHAGQGMDGVRVDGGISARVQRGFLTVRVWDDGDSATTTSILEIDCDHIQMCARLKYIENPSPLERYIVFRGRVGGFLYACSHYLTHLQHPTQLHAPNYTRFDW